MRPKSLSRGAKRRALVAAAKRCVACARNGSDSLLLWQTSDSGKERGGPPSVSLELHIIGNGSAIAEALLIVVANAIAQECGLGERVLSINNIGSTESSNRFVRDVGTYLRKHIESISPTLRPRAALDPLGTLVQLIERGHPAMPRAPQAMEYLTEDERRRFWDLLEYLEAFGLPYELSPHVLGSRDCWSHSLYQVSGVDPETGSRIPIAFGGRYDPLAARFAAAPTSAATISITCEIRGKTRAKREVARRPVYLLRALGNRGAAPFALRTRTPPRRGHTRLSGPNPRQNSRTDGGGAHACDALHPHHGTQRGGRGHDSRARGCDEFPRSDFPSGSAELSQTPSRRRVEDGGTCVEKLSGSNFQVPGILYFILEFEKIVISDALC